MGRSQEHSSSVGLLRNIRTGAVSAQFHVVYDNHFTTISSDHSQDNLPVPEGFHNLLKFATEKHFDDKISFQRNKRPNQEQVKKTALLLVKRNHGQHQREQRMSQRPKEAFKVQSHNKNKKYNMRTK